MSCSTCSRENRSDARFCDGCGAAQARACGGCGTTLWADARFCDACGVAVGSPALKASGEVERTPRDYTPKHLADKILQSKSALEGERKQVSVLFVDVKGSMELAEQLGAEAWHGILDRFFEILTEGVHRFEGTGNQYTGDGIMALFGAPIAHEDHAQRSCYSALHLRDALRGFADELRRTQSVSLSTRIEINSGDVCRRRQDRRRSTHGLHRARSYRGPRAAHGADRRGGQHGEPTRGGVMTIFLARYEKGGSSSIRFHRGWETLA
jgi:hypothetical protein